MARDHARIRLDIWTDDDWRELSSGAQWLYMRLLSDGTTSFAGVADWRPARIAAATADLTARDVEMYAVELEDGRFILPDRDSEEVMVRSFVKHDGLMRSPNVAAAFVKAHAAIASRVLRAVVVDQVTRLQEAQPDLKGWTRSEVQRVLSKRSMTFEEGLAALPANPSRNPSGKGSGNPFGIPSIILPDPASNPSGRGSVNPSVTPAPTPTPSPSPSSSAGTSSDQGLEKRVG
ncbi:hypothetical protein CLV28_0693 [Sediminihabitans luteus]|uniref:Uncharacterized protein n=1 Tax=Sediminihabitans luteus TaxID=1138585 RepID=A0A2M9CZV0_9CELL|nr:hypothetical protein [Sediminihabitans luteus]PJJ77474.1 hypothetical protein CLV28_0693 [Sediminihabitans luteus]GII98368.1 hypothetical protein Slu03_07460 [Sediminihabitans luteus]